MPFRINGFVKAMTAKDNPLGIPRTCLLNCEGGKVSDRTAKAWQEHYRTHHKIRLSEDRDLMWLRIRYQPDLLPDYDMSAVFGRFLTKRSPANASPAIRALWAQVVSDPYGLERNVGELLRQCRLRFR